jgi:large subunit ribosomal protein L9
MEVILLERIESLGQMGDVVSVKPGYARNYLLPRKKALRATEENRHRFEEQRTQLEAVNLELRSEAEQVAGKFKGLKVVLLRQAGEAGQLYGSVNARDVADEITEAGFTIQRQQVQLANPIKALGLYDVRVDLHPEVSVTVNVNVARTLEEAEIQAQTGRAMIAHLEEEAERQPRKQAKAGGAPAEATEAPPPEELLEEGVAPPQEDEEEPAEDPAAGAGADGTGESGGDDAGETDKEIG